MARFMDINSVTLQLANRSYFDYRSKLFFKKLFIVTSSFGNFSLYVTRRAAMLDITRIASMISEMILIMNLLN